MENKLFGFIGKLHALQFINLLQEKGTKHPIKLEWQEEFGYISSSVFTGT
jgi:hypothetical protein